MGSITLSPAYGRDFKSRRDAEENFASNQDWRIESIASGYAGAYATRAELKNAGIQEVELRYAKLTKVTIVKL
jgi:hypothetical protein